MEETTDSSCQGSSTESFISGKVSATTLSISSTLSADLKSSLQSLSLNDPSAINDSAQMVSDVLLPFVSSASNSSSDSFSDVSNSVGVSTSPYGFDDATTSERTTNSHSNLTGCQCDDNTDIEASTSSCANISNAIPDVRLSTPSDQTSTDISPNVSSSTKSSEPASSAIDTGTIKSYSADKSLMHSESERQLSMVELSNALIDAIPTIVDILKNRIFSANASPCENPSEKLDTMLDVLHPLVRLVLKEATFLKCSRAGDEQALEHLLAVGVNGNCVDLEKRNALHYACMNGHENCVRLLIDFYSIHRVKGRVATKEWDPKTDFEAVDVYSKTPLDYAKETHNSCVEYLEKAMEAQFNKRIKKLKKKP